MGVAVAVVGLAAGVGVAVGVAVAPGVAVEPSVPVMADAAPERATARAAVDRTVNSNAVTRIRPTTARQSERRGPEHVRSQGRRFRTALRPAQPRAVEGLCPCAGSALRRSRRGGEQ